MYKKLIHKLSYRAIRGEKFVKLKETIVELFKEGIDKVLNFYELQPSVKVTTTINLM